MMLRVFLQSLRQSRRAILVLSLGSAAFHELVLLSSSEFLADAEIPKFFSEPPRAIEAFLGGSADLLSPRGWLAAAMVHPIALALLTGAALAVAAGAVATEVERGSIDLVLSRPVGRLRYLAAKVAAALVAVTAVEAGGLAGVLLARATVERMDELTLSQALRPFAVSWALFAAVAAIGVLFSSRTSLRGRAIGLSVGFVVAAFFANFIALLIDEVSGLRYASPFHYFRPADVVAGEAIAPDIAVLLGLAAAAAAAALWAFRRRDLSR